jgi:hypothetical protein
LPAAPETVSAYLADLASEHKVATVQLRVAGINAAHLLVGASSPTVAEEVWLVLQGIRRRNGVAPEQLRPITVDQLCKTVDALPGGLSGDRDRALLVVGLVGAFRRPELVALDAEDPDPPRMALSRGSGARKRTRWRSGRQVGIPYASTALCPVTAIGHWLVTSP